MITKAPLQEWWQWFRYTWQFTTPNWTICRQTQ